MSNVAVRPADRIKSILSADTVKSQFESALGKSSGQFIASLIELYSSDTTLQKYEPGAIVKEALKAAALNLPIIKSLGFAYIVPYKNVPTFTIGYKGLIQLAQRTGQYRFINADIIFEGETVTKDKLTGEITISGTATSEKEIGYFAYIETVNGFQKAYMMTREEAEKYGKRYAPSYASQYSPWQNQFSAMAKKTCLRKLISTYGYMSVEMQSVIANDNEMGVSGPVDQKVIDIEPEGKEEEETAPQPQEQKKQEPDF